MKAQFLKIAKVKDEKAFYKKYPTEAAFFKAHPEARSIKKAQIGAYIGGDSTSNPKLIDYQKYYDEAEKAIIGSTAAERLELAEKQAAIAAAAKGGGGGGGGMDGLGGIMSMAQKALGKGDEGGGSVGEGIMSSGGFGAIGGGIGSGGIGGARYGKHIPKAQVGESIYDPSTQSGLPTYNPMADPSYSIGQNQQIVGESTAPQGAGGAGGAGFLNNAMKAVPIVGDLISGIQGLKSEKKAAAKAKQQRIVSGLQLTASTTRPEETQRRYVRPEDVAIQPNQMFPTYGVGTNVLARNGKFIKRAQDGTIETPQIDGAPTDWYEEGMDKDTYYGLKQQLDDAGYQAIPKPESVNVRDMQAITEEQPDPNQMSEEQAAAFMEMYNRDQGKSTATFDSKSARDNWVQKTGLPWSEAKRLGYTSGSAKDNNKLLAELNDPRFKKENLRTAPPKKSSQTRTPVQHRETPTGKLTPIKKPLTLDEYFKGKPKYTKDQGQIQMPDEGTMIDRLGERLANPGQTLASLAKYGELPARGFSKNDKNAYDQVLGVANPFYWANALGNAADYTEQGEYKKAAIEAADALPALGKLKYTKYIPFNKGLPPASVRRAGYLGEGAKRLGAAPAKQLRAASPRMLKQPFTPNFVMYEDGGEIQNTYAPGYLYDNLGYEPLNDSNVKQYYKGGDIPKAQGGFSNFANTLGGGGSGFSGAGAAGATPWGAIGGIGSSMANSMSGGGNASGQIGGAIGGGLGAIFGPAGMAIGQTLGTAVGNAVSPYAKKIKRDQAATKRNIENTAYNNMASSFTAPYQAHARDGREIANYEEGGYMNPEYNPQLITQFGGLDQQDFYDYAHDGMQSLRAGGHIRGEYQPVSNRGLQTYAMGGEVQTTWGGHAETISHNPYMPGSGETIMFRGKSHDESDGNGNTGIGVKYGKGGHDSYTDYAEYGTQEADADVEVERGEPAAELQDANGEKNLTVYGNLKIPNQYLDLLGDPKAKGKKFKNYIAEISKDEAKQNKIIETSTNKLNALDPQTQFDKLKLTSLQASIQGANMKLKDIADKKINAAHLQNAINDTAEENGLVADDLARGKVKVNEEAMQEYAEYGKTIKKAKDGDKIKGDKMTVKEAIAKGYKLEADGKYHLRTKSEDIPEKETRVGEAMAEIPKGQKQSASGTWGKVTPELYQQFVKDNSSWFDFTNFDPKNKDDVKYFQRRFNEEAAKTGSTAKVFVDGDLGEQTVTARIKAAKQKDPSVATDKVADIYEEDKVFDVNAKKRNPWIDLAGQVLPFFRPSDQEAFDYAQLYPEMYALGSNQLEPVQAQGYQPELATPYDISYQDQLNANQADYNSMQKLVGYNPAAQSVLAAQKYAANTGVLGEQFRANQAMQSGVYDQNRNTLNEAKLKNLDIYDRQYTRQAEAKSNTKAVTQAALNSIADKYAKHKLENRELGIYENLYNYRYDDKGRAINMNAPWQANLPNMYDKGSRTANMRKVYDEQGNFLRFEPIEETTTVTDETLDAAGRTTGIGDKKNGGKVKSKNGSIVSAYKNL